MESHHNKKRRAGILKVPSRNLDKQESIFIPLNRNEVVRVKKLFDETVEVRQNIIIYINKT